MNDRISLSAAAKRRGVSGGDIGRAGSTAVTAARIVAGDYEPAVWLGTAHARKRRPAGKTAGRPGAHRLGVSCCVCGTVRQVRPGLVNGCTHPVCRSWSKAGRQPDVPSWAGMVLMHTVSVAGFVGGDTDRIAAAGERASIVRAAAVAGVAWPCAPGGPGPDG